MTIKDIAAITGYSIGTVSRVLNHQPDVSDKARTKIQKVIDENGFQPNNNARYLKSTKPTPIMIVVKGRSNMLLTEILEQIQAAFVLRNENAEVSYIDEYENEVSFAAHVCDTANPKGFVFLGGNMDYFREGFGKIQVPSVLITNDASDLGFSNLSSFSTCDEEAAYDMMNHLISCGHRKIGIIGGGQKGSVSVRRLAGCENSIRENKIEYSSKKQYIPCRYSMQGGYDGVKSLLQNQPDTTAVFAMSDLIALGAIRALYDMGKRVPEDISVTGFDDISLCEFSIPRLTTIHQDVHELAERAVDKILADIETGKRNINVQYEYIPYQLVKRDTVMC